MKGDESIDVRTIENRLREIAGGADMISMSWIRKYTGTGADWVTERFRESNVLSVGNSHGKRYHIRDVARSLEP